MDIGVKLAKIMKPGAVNRGRDQFCADRRISMTGGHRFSALSCAVDDVHNMLRISLRRSVLPGGVCERFLGHDSGRGGERPFLEAKILERGEPRPQIVRQLRGNVVFLDAARRFLRLLPLLGPEC